jgi:hypothetical protein
MCGINSLQHRDNNGITLFQQKTVSNFYFKLRAFFLIFLVKQAILELLEYGGILTGYGPSDYFVTIDKKYRGRRSQKYFPPWYSYFDAGRKSLKMECGATYKSYDYITGSSEGGCYVACVAESSGKTVKHAREGTVEFTSTFYAQNCSFKKLTFEKTIKIPIQKGKDYHGELDGVVYRLFGPGGEKIFWDSNVFVDPNGLSDMVNKQIIKCNAKYTKKKIIRVSEPSYSGSGSSGSKKNKGRYKILEKSGKKIKYKCIDSMHFFNIHTIEFCRGEGKWCGGCVLPSGCSSDPKEIIKRKCAY